MEYELKLARDDIQLILQALGEVPLKLSGTTFSNIQRQVIDQDAASMKSAAPMPAKKGVKNA